MLRALFVLLLAGLYPSTMGAQGLTGALIGTVKDAQDSVLPGAVVTVNSPALIGGPATATADEKGRIRFPSLAPGVYGLRVEMAGFASYREDAIWIGAGATIERTFLLPLAGVAESIVVEGTGSRIEARDPGFATRFGLDDLRTIPTRRASMFDFIRAAPGISPTSPSSGPTSSGTTTTISSFGSGTNENQFLIDGTNFTCPCNGIARAEPGVDFIQEIQVHSIGASAEFGNVQGAVINVVTRQGGNRLISDASYYWQPASLTAQPVLLPIQGSNAQSGYERHRYRDFSTSLGGPAVRERLWLFAGYQHLRDYDSQPGTDSRFPRTYKQDKVFAKFTWRLSPAWQLVQSVHDEFWVSPEQPTVARPFDTTLRLHASVPAFTFADVTHTSARAAVWNVRFGRFVYSREDDPSTGRFDLANRSDSVTGLSSGGPPSFGSLTLIRTTGKATFEFYRPDWAGGDHQLKVGTQLERGEHHSTSVIPTGRRFNDSNSRPSQMISSDPSSVGGLFMTAAAFASDAITLGSRVTVNAGVRFDHSRAISQDLPAIDANGEELDRVIDGLGTMYTWNAVSPRLGVTARLTGDGRTMLRASYGRFHQGVLTGELHPFHPGGPPVTTRTYVEADRDYTFIQSVVDSRSNVQFDAHTRPPRTDEMSLGVDRELGRRLSVAIAYIRKTGANFIGWTDVGGQYAPGTRTLRDGRTLPVFVLTNRDSDRRYLLTNQDNYSLRYNGVVFAAEKRRSSGWQAFGSYSWSKAAGLQPSSGANASAAQVSTIAPPPAPSITFGRDPNDLTNATGRLPNDRPHMFRAMSALQVPGTPIELAANLQHFSGKPWAATTQVSLPQNNQQRLLLESRGTRRLSSQTLLDLRISTTVRLRRTRLDLLVDVLNALNENAEEGIASDNFFSSTFAAGTSFVDPRRVMLGVRLKIGE